MLTKKLLGLGRLIELKPFCVVGERLSPLQLMRAGIVLIIILASAACGSQIPATAFPQPAVQASSTSRSVVEVASPTAQMASSTSIPTLPGSTSTTAPKQAQALSNQTPAAATSACKSPAALTPAVTEGPYFTAGSPERATLIDSNTQGMILTLTGTVLTADCQPVAHALLDFWQANSEGQYDNAGYTLRGHQFTDENGRYRLETVIPGLYPGRTVHIHVKVQAPNGPLLTTQLFFPGVAGNQSDGIYDPALLITIQATDASSMQASYNFVIFSK